MFGQHMRYGDTRAGSRVESGNTTPTERSWKLKRIIMKNALKATLLSVLLGLTTLAIAQESVRININTADAETLAQLPGIGATKAQAIVADREANGPFASADDLDRVSGIGEATVESLRDSIEL